MEIQATNYTQMLQSQVRSQVDIGNSQKQETEDNSKVNSAERYASGDPDARVGTQINISV